MKCIHFLAILVFTSLSSANNYGNNGGTKSSYSSDSSQVQRGRGPIHRFTGGWTGGVIPAAVQTTHNVEVRPVDLPSEPLQPAVVLVDAGMIPLTILFRSMSSALNVMQQHVAGEAGEEQHTQSEDEPHRLFHEVSKPIIQEVREVIAPYRRVVQEIQPVQEEIQTIVARGQDRPQPAHSGASGVGYGGAGLSTGGSFSASSFTGSNFGSSTGSAHTSTGSGFKSNVGSSVGQSGGHVSSHQSSFGSVMVAPFPVPQQPIGTGSVGQTSGSVGKAGVIPISSYNFDQNNHNGNSFGTSFNNFEHNRINTQQQSVSYQNNQAQTNTWSNQQKQVNHHQAQNVQQQAHETGITQSSNGKSEVGLIEQAPSQEPVPVQSQAQEPTLIKPSSAKHTTQHANNRQGVKGGQSARGNNKLNSPAKNVRAKPHLRNAQKRQQNNVNA